MNSSEIYQNVTDRIVSMLDTGAADPAAWRAPWRAIALGHRSALGRGYRGINTLLLGDRFERAGYSAPIWATYKQWQGLGAQVLKGEKGATVVLWKSYTRKQEGEGETTRSGLFATSFSVFNIAQVDHAPESLEQTERAARNSEGRVLEAEQWIDSTGAQITYGGDRAYFSPGADRIALPRFEDFDNSESFYSTAAHELTHWSGHESRLARDLSGRFGQQQYAAEELIAELGSAFAMARLGLEGEPRADHAHYLASWAQLLKGDPRAVFTAASRAQTACDYLFGTQGETCEQGDR